MVKRWGEPEDAKLKKLIEQKHGGIDPKKIDIDTVKAVHTKYFPEFKYSNFAPLFRGKVRSWCANKNLDGHRKSEYKISIAMPRSMRFLTCCFPGSQEAKDKEAGKNLSTEEGSSSDDSSYNGESEEDIDLEADSEEEDSKMPATPVRKSKRTPKKTTPAPVQATSPDPPAAATVDTVQQMTSALSNMRLGVVPFSMAWKFPFIITPYKEGNDDMINIDIFSITVPKEMIHPEVIEGAMFHLKVQVPAFFTMETRIIAAEAETEGFNKDTHLAQEFKARCEAIDKYYNYANEIFGAPQKIALPFVCEERIVAWEVQAYPNEDVTLTELLGSPQFFQTISVTLRKLRRKRRVVGGFKIVGINPNEMADGN